MLNIVHIIHGDKFTFGYIQFMEFYLKEYQHFFITFSGFRDDSFSGKKGNFIKLKRVSELSSKQGIRDILHKADKIIVSGVFGAPQSQLIKFGDSVLRKTYFQFWGGDFYLYRNIKISGYHTFRRQFYDKAILVKCINKCAGIINLIPGDWDEFYKIFPYDVKHFVAPMPSDPNKAIDYGAYRRSPEIKDVYRILVGNSATETNCHIDAFEKMKVFADENVEIIVPLSYGDTGKYRDSVIESGRRIFRNKFKPVLDFINKDDYIELLNSCDIGVFNNDRQQGMGNIDIMLSLGKKVYARRDTAMWSYYSSLGITLYDVCDISHTNIANFILLDKEVADANIAGIEKKRRHENSVDLWRKVFEDEI